MTTNTLNEVIAGFHRRDTAITFVSKVPQPVTYEELGQRVFANARRFAGAGIARGDRVAIAMESDLEHVVGLFSLMALGAMPLSLKPRRGSVEEHAKQVGALCKRFGVKATYGALPTCEGVLPIAWDAEAKSDDRSIVAEVSKTDVAFVQFSSGSLGDPKAVPIKHGMLLENLLAHGTTDGRQADSMGYNFLPLSHDMGLVGGLFGAILEEQCLSLSSVQEFLRRPTEVFKRHEREKCLLVAMPDFALRYLARHLAQKKKDDADAKLLACVKRIYCGAEPIRRATIAELLAVAPAFGLDPHAIVFSYGLAEATLLVSAHDFVSLAASFTEGPGKRVFANVGKPYGARMEVKIDAAAREEGAEGPIWIRGPSVFSGYLDGAPLEDGWYDTGDVGFVKNGDLFISGRTKELIIVNGENIFPSDIEDLVAALPGVEEPLVMPEEDRFYLLVVPASAKTGVDAAQIASAVAARFGAAPTAIAVGPARSILRTTSGKPMREPTLAELRKAGLLPAAS